MPTLTLRLMATALACLALFWGPGALAQGNQRWFRVELLIFSHQNPVTSERWESTPTLAYPGAARFLIERDRVASNAARHGGDSIVDEFGRQIITLPDPGVENSAAPTGSGTAAAPLRPTPFVALPAGELEFRGKAAYMQRLGRYRTLFHQGWVQPVASDTAALPIVLDRSGDTDQWPVLQGSIKLFLSRYLHIETNLWMNTSGNYLPGTWRMPAPPLGPPSLVIEAPASIAEQETVTRWNTGDEPGYPLPEDEMAPDPQEVTGPVYPFRHAVLLQQKRRMRSNEVHYLDHPLFGVVVQLTPVSEEELEQMALAEAQSMAAAGQSR